MPPDRSRIAVVTILAGALTAGCGGTGAPSAADYRAHARARCQAAERRIVERGAGLKFAESVHLGRATYDAVYRDLASGARPPGFADFVRAAGRVRVALRRLDGVMERDAGFEQIEREGSALRDEASAFESVAEAAGLAECGRPARRGGDQVLLPAYRAYTAHVITQWDREMRRAARIRVADVAGAQRLLAGFEIALERLQASLGEAAVPEPLRARHDALDGAVSEAGRTITDAQTTLNAGGYSERARYRLRAVAADIKKAAAARDRLAVALVRGS